MQIGTQRRWHMGETPPQRSSPAPSHTTLSCVLAHLQGVRSEGVAFDPAGAEKVTSGTARYFEPRNAKHTPLMCASQTWGQRGSTYNREGKPEGKPQGAHQTVADHFCPCSRCSSP